VAVSAFPSRCKLVLVYYFLNVEKGACIGKLSIRGSGSPDVVRVMGNYEPI